MEHLLDKPYIALNDYETRLKEFQTYIKVLALDENEQIHGRLVTEKINDRPLEIEKHRNFNRLNVQFYANKAIDCTNLEEFEVWLNKPNSKVSYKPLNWNGKERLVGERVYGGNAFYIVVNGGGHDTATIKQRKSHYIDVDFGKETKYFATEEEALVAQKEASKNKDNSDAVLERLVKGFKLTVNKTKSYIEAQKRKYLKENEWTKKCMVLETFNGLHIYFLMKVEEVPNEADARANYISRFKAIQNALIEKYNGDKQVNDLPRILRAAGFIHWKREPFVVRILHIPDESIRFTEQELIHTLRLDVREQKPGKKSKEKETITHVNPKTKQQKHMDFEFEKRIPSKDNKLRELLNYNADFEPQEMTKSKFADWVVKQPIHKFFKEGALPTVEKEHFSCYFHIDTNPSSVIYCSKESEKYYYRCFGCSEEGYEDNGEGLGRDIIRIIQELFAYGWQRTLEKLAQITNVTIVKTEYEDAQYEKLRQAISFANNLDEIIENGEIHSKLAELLSSRTRQAVLMQLALEAQESVVTPEYEYNGCNMFFKSLRTVGKKISRFYAVNPKIVLETINTMCLLGFIEKVPEKQINPQLLEKSLHIKQKKYLEELEASSNKTNKDGSIRKVSYERINYYIVHNPYDVLLEAERIAEKMTQTGFAITSDMKRKQILNTFGEEATKRIFPDDEIKLNVVENELKEKIEKKIIKTIEKNGYCLDTELLKVSNYKLKATKKRPTAQELKNVYSKFVKKGFTSAKRVNNNASNRKIFGYDCTKAKDVWLKS